MKHLTMRARLTLSYAALFAVLLGGVGAVLYRTVARGLERTINERLDHICTGLWGYIEFDNGGPVLVYDQEDHDILYFIRGAARYYQLYDAEDGRLLLEGEDSALLHLARSPDEVKRLRDNPDFDEAVAAGGVRFRFRSMGFRSKSQHSYLLRAGVSLEDEESDRKKFLSLLLLLVPAVVVVAVVAGTYMAGRALKPISQLQLAAHDISISQLARRLPLRGTGDELDRLAATFNDTFSRLEKSVDEMKQFTAGISHELRTPLACLQGEAEVALMDSRLGEPCRQVLTSQLEEFQKLNALLRRLLTLARAEAGEIRLATEPFDVSQLLVSTAEQIKFIADNRGVSLEVKCPGPIAVVGDPRWLEAATVNLLDNAIKFTSPGGRVLLECKAEASFAVIEVSHNGAGIAPADLPRVFDRFFRADSSRSKEREGLGLGLTMAKWIIEAQHGSISVQSELGAGSCFTIRLPLAHGAA